MLDRAPRVRDLLELSLMVEAMLAGLETQSAIGCPLGGPEFLDRASALLRRDMRPARRGRKPKEGASAGG